MPLKPVINVKCPCCREVLEVDVEKERVISHRKGKHLRDDAGEGESALDVALRQHKESSEGIEDRFKKAADREANRASRLDDLFREAQKKASEEEVDPNDPFGGKKIWD